MTRKAVLIGSLLLFGLSPNGFPAQGSGCTTRTVAVGVVDSAGNLVPNLSAANFHAKLHGHDVQILSASLDSGPRRIVLVLDASGSMMNAGPGWKIEKSISEYLMQVVPQRASIAQVAFATRVFATVGFNQDPPMLLKNLADLERASEYRHWGPGKTALYDAISSARDLFGVPNVGNTILVLSDGADNRSKLSVSDVRRNLIAAGVRLFAVLIMDQISFRTRMPEEINGPSQLRDVVKDTGGMSLMLPKFLPSDAHGNTRPDSRVEKDHLALKRLFRQMVEFYQLEVSLSETIEKPTKWKLEVLDASGMPMRGVEVHYPQELMPCAMAGP
jgi:hypothetical protein